MKRGEYGKHTRGEWKHNELVWAVLAGLYVSKQNGLLPLPMNAIHKMTGGNYRAISNKLPTWVDLGWIRRYRPRHVQYFVKPVYELTSEVVEIDDAGIEKGVSFQ